MPRKSQDRSGRSGHVESVDSDSKLARDDAAVAMPGTTDTEPKGPWRSIGSQAYVLRAINALYLNGSGVQVDPMYGKGSFYRDDFPYPQFIGDLSGESPAIKINACYLPFPNGTVKSVILDPPFMHAHGKNSAMSRYKSYPSQRALQALYLSLLQESMRVLETGGILIFKCQDTVESGKQVWSHIKVHDMATSLGFQVVDLFVVEAQSRMTGHNHARQVHARKFHSYFWVFRKKLSLSEDKDGTMVDSQGRVYHQMPLRDIHVC